MFKHFVGTSVAVLATTLTGGLLSAVPADAAGGASGSFDGRVISATSLKVRYGPTTAASSVGSIKPGKVIPLQCKVRGTSVDGNNIWYSLPPNLNEWVSARYVANVGAAPDWCGTDARYAGRATVALTKRTGPTTRAARAGTVAKGEGMSIICKLPGENVNGNSLWYYRTDGRWVAARYVTNIGGVPGFCN